MTGEGLAQVITSIATLAGVIGSLIVQFRARTESRAGRAEISDKIDTTAAKVDDNTALTQATAAKVDEVHSATVSIVGATGAHPALKSE